MKKIFLITLMIFSLSSFAQKQGRPANPKSPEEKSARQTEELTKRLSLNKEQIEKIKLINLESDKKMKDLRDQKLADKKAMMVKHKQINENRALEIKKLLNDNQKKEFDKMIQERKSKMKEDRSERHGEPHDAPRPKSQTN